MTVESRPPTPKNLEWFSNAPLHDQLTQVPYRGEGFLMRIQDHNILGRMLFQTMNTLRPDMDPTELAFISDAYRFMEEAHGNQKRKRNNTLHIVHPTRCAIRAAKHLDTTALDIAILLTHDTIEDCSKTREDFIRYFHKEKGYSLPLVENLYIGVNALSHKTSKGKLKPSKYNRQILKTNIDFPFLGVVNKKNLDRADNYLDDLVDVIDHPEKAESLWYYRTKALDAFHLGQLADREAFGTGLLGQVIELTGEKLPPKKQKKGGFTTIFTTFTARARG